MNVNTYRNECKLKQVVYMLKCGVGIQELSSLYGSL